MSSTLEPFKVPQIPPGMSGPVALVSLAVAVAFSSGYWTPIVNNEAFQVLALTLGSIVAVAIVAGILICIPDFLNGGHHSRRRGRGRARHRTRHGSNKNSNKSRQSDRSRERLNQNEYPSSASATSQSSQSTSTSSSRKKSPSMPPLPIQPRSTGAANHKNAPGRVPVSAAGKSNQRTISQRRYSSPPCLPSQESPSQYLLNPIAERKLEDLMDFDDYWWRELDSRTQYYALILGYTQATWDDDFELDDLPCEDWDWEEMTKEQKAAAQHFGYNEETWSD